MLTTPLLGLALLGFFEFVLSQNLVTNGGTDFVYSLQCSELSFFVDLCLFFFKL